MRVLLDHCMPRRLRVLLPGHDVQTAREMRWEELKNGQLLRTAGSHFEAFLSVDKSIQHEQNLDQLPIAIIVLDAPSNALPGIAPFVPYLQELLKSPLRKVLYMIAPDGKIAEYGNTRNP